MAASLGTTLRRPVVALIVAAWLLIGLASGYAYVHRYAIYRGFAVPSTPAGVAQGTVRQVDFWSPAVHQRTPYLVYLPPGYAAQAAQGRHFPVLYLLHGYPGKMPVWINVDAVHVAANKLISRHRMKPMILVMPSGKTGTLGADTEWADTPSGQWMSYLVDLVHNVDARFATLADRQHRGIAGPSEGAYGAMNVALHHLREFSVVQAWGGYFTQTPTGVFANATPAAVRANSPGSYVASRSPTIHRLGLRAWLFQGRSDPLNPAILRSFSRRLHAAGADVHLGFFPGGHDWALFRRQTPHMLRAASHAFSQRPGAPPQFTAVG